jgi:hypothetical protein
MKGLMYETGSWYHFEAHNLNHHVWYGTLCVLMKRLKFVMNKLPNICIDDNMFKMCWYMDPSIYDLFRSLNLNHLYSASLLKQQSAGRHVTPLGHIIPTSRWPLPFLLNAVFDRLHGCHHEWYCFTFHFLLLFGRLKLHRWCNG